MSDYILLLCVVPNNKAELVSNAALQAGSFGGTVSMGRGISSNNMIASLGFGDTSKEIVYILTERNKKDDIASSIQNACSSEKPNFGFMIALNASCMLKAGTISGGESTMLESTTHELITVILNKGYADDAMAAARKAGAGGGTVINARGTAREDDAKFFGMHIVPEKEMLLIVVEKEKKESVLTAMKTLPCLAEPGSGIAFCSGAESFTLLGKK